jgi:hypothetical protein
VRLLLATNHLGLGGSESYLLTVAEQFDRLGHEATIFAPELGNGVQAAVDRGLTVVGEADLPRECDSALVQDAGVALQLVDRYPEAPQLFVAHSETFNLQMPPQLPGVVSKVIAMNDRVARRMRSCAVELEVVRMTQPIDTERFASRGGLPESPRRALLLSNNTPISDHLETLEAACKEAGIELSRLGGLDGQIADPREALAAADIVVGYGRSVLEAMACGRAAYVYDWHGGDGWVTPESYPVIESDGFAARSGRAVLPPQALAEDLRRYSPAMGPANHDLVVGNHRATVHAQELLRLFGELSAGERSPRSHLEEMARLVRLEWRARTEVLSLRAEVMSLNERANQAEARAAEVAEETRRSYEDTLSWRLTAPLRWLSTRFRRRRAG